MIYTTQCSPYCTLYTSQYTVHCKLYNILCIVYNVHCIVYNVHPRAPWPPETASMFPLMLRWEMGIEQPEFYTILKTKSCRPLVSLLPDPADGWVFDGGLEIYRYKCLHT